MSCVLRVFGDQLDVHELLTVAGWVPAKVFGSSAPKTAAPDGPNARTSGAVFDVSRAELTDFAGQLRDALTFLRERGGVLSRIRSLPGVEGLVMDFAVAFDARRPPHAFAMTSELVRAAGSAGVALELSVYPSA